MELESIMLSEISLVVKDKYHMISPISGTYKANEQNRTRDMEIKKNWQWPEGWEEIDNKGKKGEG